MMPRIDSALFLIVLAAVFDAVVGPWYAFDKVHTNFILIAFLYLAWFWPTFSLLVLSTTFAFALSFVSLNSIGLLLTGLLPAIYLAGRIKGWFIVEHSLLRCWILLPILILSFSLQAFPWKALSMNQFSWQSVELLTPTLSALYTTALAFIVHSILDRFRLTLGWDPEPSNRLWR